MGSIYQRKGSQYLWIKYRDAAGRVRRESTETAKQGIARRILRTKEGEAERGVAPVEVRRFRFEDAAEDFLNDYRSNGRASLDCAERRLRLHLRPFWSGARMAAISTTDVREFVTRRQGAGASNAEINRELAVLKRMFKLGYQAGKLAMIPYIPMLRESGPRSGFFEPSDLARVISLLPESLKPVIRFAYLTGWRINSEILPLEWRLISFEEGTIRLDHGTTKNGEGRVFPLTPELKALLQDRRDVTDAINRSQHRVVSLVFHRDGEPIRSFRAAWTSATKRAGVPGRLPHDLRRTAIRNFVRAGIPERVAMQMSGHKTRAVFERYNIVSGSDYKDAANKLSGIGGTVLGTFGSFAQTAGDDEIKKQA